MTALDKRMESQLACFNANRSLSPLHVLAVPVSSDLPRQRDRPECPEPGSAACSLHPVVGIGLVALTFVFSCQRDSHAYQHAVSPRDFCPRWCQD